MNYPKITAKYLQDQELKTFLFRDYENDEDLKEMKKYLTKIKNKIGSGVREIGKMDKIEAKINELNEPILKERDRLVFGSLEHNRERYPLSKDELEGLIPFEWDNQNDEPFKIAVDRFFEQNPRLERPIILKVNDNKEYQELLKIKDIKLQEQKDFYNNFKEHFDKQDERILGNLLQRRIQANKSAQKSDENAISLAKFWNQMKDWKHSENEGFDLIINGKNVGNTATVGAMIGSGKRIHKMVAEVVEYKDKLTKETLKGISLGNRTQWWNSDLIIVDLWENISDEVKSLYN